MNTRKSKGAIFLFFVFLCMASSNAVDIDIHGRIIHSLGDSISFDSISGARISLKNHPEIVCYSDFRGNFRLTNKVNAFVKQSVSNGNTDRIRFVGKGASKGTCLSVRTAGQGTPMTIGLYRADGRLVTSSRFAACGAADRFIMLPQTAPGVHLVAISIDNSSKVFRTVPSMGFIGKMRPHNSKTMLGSISMNKKASSSIIDTLMVYSRGYMVGFYGVESLEIGNFIGELAVAKPWDNCMCGFLLRRGTLIGLRLMNHNIIMGQPRDDIFDRTTGRPTADLEQPPHSVTFTHNYLVDSTEVTQGLFDSLMKKTYAGYVGPPWSDTFGLGPRYPAYSVSWYDAVLFCNARSKLDTSCHDTAYTYSGIIGAPGASCRLTNVKTNLFVKAFRLPTEAEWEAVCRGNASYTDFNWGVDVDYYRDSTRDSSDIDKSIWARNSWDLGRGNSGFGVQSVPESGQRMSSYNLYDITGNLSEWCNDWLGPYKWENEIDPAGPDTGTTHVLRGGNWGNDYLYLRSANRYFSVPAGQNENVFIGFRTLRIADITELGSDDDL